ncbi:MAG TPA: glycerol-3-phosphate 1-O-acyltransferase PlsY, partial [Erysipelothrix sp.]|nr:glycerol-3-phosphate 1-O-acyltransferase PlsY [Erysipelothrix sp.]
MNIIISSLIGYLIGSIPFALVIGKVFYKVDIREHGSGNLGGTNAGRTLGAKAGISVAILDILKAFIAIVIVSFIDPNTMIYAGFFATIGHCYPIFANFKGGKAVSTAAGFLVSIAVMITHNPLHVIIPLVIVFTVLYFTKMVSLSTMIALVSASIVLVITKAPTEVSTMFIIVTLIVIYRHKDNIQRII